MIDVGTQRWLYEMVEELPRDALPPNVDVYTIVNALEIMTSAGDELEDACFGWLQGEESRDECAWKLTKAVGAVLDAVRVIVGGPVTPAETTLHQLTAALDSITNALA